MTLRNFFMGRGLVLLALLVFGILFFIFKIYVFDFKNQVVDPSLVVEDINNEEVESSPIINENDIDTNIVPDKEVIIDKGEPNQKLNIKNKTECESNSGVWYATGNICEINSFSENMCVARGGEWNGCASACRHDKDAEVCTLQCVLTCSFK
jgi:hypothetical protein